MATDGSERFLLDEGDVAGLGLPRYRRKIRGRESWKCKDNSLKLFFAKGDTCTESSVYLHCPRDQVHAVYVTASQTAQ